MLQRLFVFAGLVSLDAAVARLANAGLMTGVVLMRISVVLANAIPVECIAARLTGGP